MANNPENITRMQELQQEHLKIVLALTQANSDLLLVRQQASGIEFEVLAVERDHAEKGDKVVSEAMLSDIHSQDAQAKQKLAKAEHRVEEMERRMDALALMISEL